jgi:hypothetical protein
MVFVENRIAISLAVLIWLCLNSPQHQFHHSHRGACACPPLVLESSNAAPGRIGDLQALAVLPGDRQGPARISPASGFFDGMMRILIVVETIKSCVTIGLQDPDEVLQMPA